MRLSTSNGLSGGIARGTSHAASSRRTKADELDAARLARASSGQMVIFAEPSQAKAEDLLLAECEAPRDRITGLAERLAAENLARETLH